MKIILNDAITLEPLTVTGGPQFIQGQTRDALSFIFPDTVSMEELDEVFNSDNCEYIKINDGTNQYIHKGYTIRAKLAKEHVEVKKATESEPAVFEDSITVVMGQRTYIETQLSELETNNEVMAEAIDAILMGDIAL